MSSDVRLSSACRFAEEEKVIVKRKAQSKDFMEFLDKFPAFGLTPEFYNMGLLDEDGQYCQLKGFDGNIAVIDKYERRNGKYESSRCFMEYEEAAARMIAMAEEEMNDLKARWDFMEVGFQSSKNKKAAKEIRKRIKTLQESLEMYNGHMHAVSAKMGLPYRCGYKTKYSENVYEFVSYVEGLENPYVIENITRKNENANRFTYINFDSLVMGVKEYAKTEDIEIDFKKVKPMEEESNIATIQVAASGEQLLLCC